MRSTFAIAVSGALAVALALLGGCTGTDVITVDTGNVLLEFEVRNLDQTRFESGTVVVANLNIRPVDPAANAALGGEPIGLVARVRSVDMASGVVTFSAPPLHSGTYSVESLILSTVVLFDEDPPMGSPRCIEGVVNPGPDRILDTADDFASLPDPRFNLNIGTPFLDLTDFPAATLTVPPNGTGRLRVVFDAVALATSFEDAFVCSPAPTVGPTAKTCRVGTTRFPSHSCLFRFAEDDFEATSPAFVSFE